MKIPLKCKDCGCVVGCATMPDDFREMVPIQFRAIFSLLPADFKLEAASVASVLNIQCAEHSHQR